VGDASTTISVASMLQRDHGPTLLADNQAIGNTTSTQCLSWWESNIRGHEGRVVILGCGINDLGASIPAATTQANLAQIETEAVADGAAVIYATYNPISNAPAWTPTFQTTINAMRAWMFGRASRPTVYVADNYLLLGDAGTALLAGYDTGDGVHQNGTANAVLESNFRGMCADAGLPCN
jgi:hypothetical protein